LKHSGLNLIDIETSIKASRLTWISKLFSEGSLPWKAYINHLLENYGSTEIFIQAPVAQKLDSAIHRINLYPVDNAIGFPAPILIHWIVIYPVDSAIQLLNNWSQM